MALNSFKDEFWRPVEVARVLRISVKTLYNMRARGEGPPAYKLGGRGGRARYRRSDVEAWIEQGREVNG